MSCQCNIRYFIVLICLSRFDKSNCVYAGFLVILLGMDLSNVKQKYVNNKVTNRHKYFSHKTASFSAYITHKSDL